MWLSFSLCIQVIETSIDRRLQAQMWYSCNSGKFVTISTRACYGSTLRQYKVWTFNLLNSIWATRRKLLELTNYLRLHMFQTCITGVLGKFISTSSLQPQWGEARTWNSMWHLTRAYPLHHRQSCPSFEGFNNFSFVSNVQTCFFLDAKSLVLISGSH